jgi:hypothetical protein
LYQYLPHLPKHRMQWHASVYFKKWEGLCHMFINKRMHNNQTQFCYFWGNWYATTEVNFKTHVCMQHKYISLFSSHRTHVQLMLFLMYGAISLYIDCVCDIYLIMLQHPSDMIPYFQHLWSHSAKENDAWGRTLALRVFWCHWSVYVWAGGNKEYWYIIDVVWFAKSKVHTSS